jgi:hypothetical protein
LHLVVFEQIYAYRTLLLALRISFSIDSTSLSDITKQNGHDLHRARFGFLSVNRVAPAGISTCSPDAA